MSRGLGDVYKRQVLGGSAATAVNAVAVIMVLGTAYNDALSEINAGAGTFTPVSTGTYRFWGVCEATCTASTSTINNLFQTVTLYVDGVATQQFGRIFWPYANSTAATGDLSCSGMLSLTAAQVVTFRFVGSFAGTGLTAAPTVLHIQRLS